MNKSKKDLSGFKGMGMYLGLCSAIVFSGISAPIAKAGNPVVAQSLQASAISITGTVKDQAGVPLPGAFLQANESMNYVAMSDFDGKYSLEVPAGATIKVSLMGFSDHTFTVSAAGVYDIVLKEDSEFLQEVVVVGYGTQKKETVTGSIASVKGKELQRSPEANLTNSLVGRMPGIIANNRSGEPGNDYSEILIRGKSTFGNTQPLFVIDGVANRWGNIDNLNPNDIESMTILKDASAAIYGSQAANGVILVTTKRGKDGKPKITYDGSFSLSENTRTPQLMDAYSYMVYDDEINAADYPGNPAKQLYTNIKGQYIEGTNDRRLYDDTDWMSVVFQKAAPKTRHSLSVSGGTDNVKYYMSGSYLYQKPGYRDTQFNFQTFQLRSNVDAKITKDLTVGLELAARQEDRHESNYSTFNLFKEAFNAYPYLPDYYDNGLPGPGIAWGNNLAILVQGGTGYYKVKDFYLNSKFSVDLQMPWITKGLYFNAYVAMDKQFRNQKTQNGMWHAYQYNPQTDTYDDIYETTGYQTIDLYQQNNSNSMNTIVAKLGYDRSFDRHSVNAFVAYEQSREDGCWFSGYRKDFYTLEPDQLFAGADKDKNATGNAYVTARQNIFGRLSYAYMDRYLAEFTLRYDGSMNFPKDKRWGLFPGLSVGWRISEEPFMQNVSFVDELKLKASVGQLGNDSVASFQYLGNYNLSAGAQFGEDPVRYNGFTIGRVANPNITWEVATTYNAGFESRLFDNRLSMEAQYFFSHRENILTTRNASIPSYTGLTLPDENIGIINNQGVELEAMYRDYSGDLNWYVGGNFTFARNKVVFFDEAANVPDWQKRTGHPIDSYLLYLTDGLFQTKDEIKETKAKLPGVKPGDIKHIDYDGSGDITSTDMVRIFQSPTPEIVYGISFGGSWRGLELNVLLQGQARATAYIIPTTYNRDIDYFNNRWISADLTPDAKYPRAFSKDDLINTLSSDFWLKDAWFLRLKNLEFAYTLPKKALSKVGFESLRLYVSGSNLFTLDEIKILDPECGNSGGLYYPQQRIYNIGMVITL
ncbi:MAG: SusC/RagA family TonB-linked outer membrane protein [Candidatus Cryptobacteroides sp.]